LSYGVRQQEKSFLIWGVFLVCGALLGIGLGVTLGLATIDNGLVAPEVSIQGIAIGGQTPQAAWNILRENLHPENLERDLTLSWQRQRWVLHPQEFQAEFALSEAIQKAMLVGRDGNDLQNFLSRYLGIGSKVDIPVEVTYNQEKLTSFVSRIAQEINQEPLNAQMIIHPDDTIEVVDGKKGQKLNSAKTIALIKENFWNSQGEIQLPVETWKPEVTAEIIHQRGIKRLIGSISSTFSTAKANRTYNIKVAAKAIDGVMLKPGEIFSFNKIVGPRSQEAGYKMAGVIVNNELVDGLGGGVCQVSSTLYNAILLANLEVVQRTNHSRPISYFPLGRDATVAYDYLDLKFKNNTGKYVLLRAEVQGNKLLIRVFGDRPAGETVSIVTSTTNVLPYSVKEVTDSSLPAGARVVEKKGGSGFKVNVWRIVKINGQELKRELISQDTYNPASQVVRVGASHAKPEHQLKENHSPKPKPPTKQNKASSDSNNSNSSSNSTTEQKQTDNNSVPPPKVPVEDQPVVDNALE